MSYIYAYSKDSLLTHHNETYNTAVKVGFTTTQPAKRVKQQDGTAQNEPLILLGHWDIPSGFSDKDVHAVLENLGYTRTRDDAEREWFNIKAESTEEQLLIIHKAIKVATQDNSAGCIDLELTPLQYEFIENTLDAFDRGETVCLAELCPRFGKTATAMALLACIPERVMVVATYWLSALTSFENDVVKFKQLENLRYVDASEPGVIQQHLDSGFKVVIGVSLHSGKNGRDYKKADLQYIVDINEKIVFIDEADFGAHRDKQKEIVDFLCQ